MESNVLRLKERIKLLVVLQIKTKRARKTTISNEEYRILKKEIENLRGCELPVWWDHNSAASDAVSRAVEITAYLNAYHEARGSDYRHNINDRWYYAKYEKQIREELAKDCDHK